MTGDFPAECHFLIPYLVETSSYCLHRFLCLLLPLLFNQRFCPRFVTTVITPVTEFCLLRRRYRRDPPFVSKSGLLVPGRCVCVCVCVRGEVLDHCFCFVSFCLFTFPHQDLDRAEYRSIPPSGNSPNVSTEFDYKVGQSVMMAITTTTSTFYLHLTGHCRPRRTIESGSKGPRDVEDCSTLNMEDSI